MNGIELVHLAVYDTMADWEPGHAIAHINSQQWQRSPGRFRVRTVAETPEPITTMGGVRIVPDLTVAELEPESSAMPDEWSATGRAVWSTRSTTSSVRSAAGRCGMATMPRKPGGLPPPNSARSSSYRDCSMR